MEAFPAGVPKCPRFQRFKMERLPVKNSHLVSPIRRCMSLAAFLTAVAWLVGCNGALTTPLPAISISISLPTASVQTGMTQQFSATVSNITNTAITWQVNGVVGGDAAHGTISASGLYTAPATVPNRATVTVTAVAQADTSKTSSSAVTITAPPTITVTVSPKTPSVQVTLTQQFMSTVSNSSNQNVTWQVNGTTGGDATHGTISTTGLYTAPVSVPSPATVSVKAISQADNTKSDTATVTVTAAPPPITVTVSPKTPSVQVALTQQFMATVANSSNQNVTWQVNGTTGGDATHGTISTMGLYTAPASVPSPATVTIKAISQADNTKSDTATVTVTAAPSVTVTVMPKRAAITTGQAQTFVPTVTGSSNSNVTWEVDTVPGGNTTVGNITVGGVYTPPTSAGVHNVVARSTANTSVTSATSTVAVTDLAGVFTYHNNNSRDGVNTKEYALTTSTVATATFGKLFSCPVDGAVYAQPLWVANVTISSAKHNVLVVATEHDSVYAFDADASPCATLWHANLLDSAHGGTSGEVAVPGANLGSGFGDLAPEVGITGTPVIDQSTNTIYVVSKSENTGTATFFQRLHGLDLLTGSEKLSGPKAIDSSITYPGTGDGSSGGNVPFHPQNEHQRPGLALAGGIVYVAWASHEDHDPYHGWIIGFSASDLSLQSKYNDSPNGNRGGIWMAGGAPSIDSSNNLFVITGNGDFDGTKDFGDSILKLPSNLDPTSSAFDFFTPSIQNSLNASDLDLGAGGAVVLVDLPSAPAGFQHLLIGGGKGAGFSGQLYSLDRTNLGQFNASDIGAKQIFAVGGGIFATPAFWQNTLYIAGSGTNLLAYSLGPTTGVFTTPAASLSATSYGFPGATPSISATGTTNGVVWALDNHSYCTSQSPSCGPAVLHAYDATNLATELWNSTQGTGNTAGNAVKFTVPTVANGKVYIGTRGNNAGGADSSTSTPGEMDVYGLKPN